MTKRKTPGNAVPSEGRSPAGHPENPVDGGAPSVGPLTVAWPHEPKTPGDPMLAGGDLGA